MYLGRSLGVSRTIYVSVDSPNLGFPYFLGGTSKFPWINRTFFLVEKMHLCTYSWPSTDVTAWTVPFWLKSDESVSFSVHTFPLTGFIGAFPFTVSRIKHAAIYTLIVIQ